MIKYRINSTDVYNIDETWFHTRVIAGQVVIIHLTTKAVYLADSNTGEFLTAVETVCTDSSTISLILILKGDILLEKYFENDFEDETLLATSSSGYSNEGLAMNILSTSIIIHTKRQERNSEC